LVADSPEVPRQAPKAEAARKGSRLGPVEAVGSAAKPRLLHYFAASRVPSSSQSGSRFLTSLDWLAKADRSTE
jgi:hypothetical protein